MAEAADVGLKLRLSCPSLQKMPGKGVLRTMVVSAWEAWPLTAPHQESTPYYTSIPIRRPCRGSLDAQTTHCLIYLLHSASPSLRLPFCSGLASETRPHLLHIHCTTAALEYRDYTASSVPITVHIPPWSTQNPGSR